MTHKQVKSSVIKSIGYDPKTRKIEVKFSGGGTYAYDDVSAAEHHAFVSSESVGQHFAKHIKGKDGRKVGG